MKNAERFPPFGNINFPKKEITLNLLSKNIIEILFYFNSYKLRSLKNNFIFLLKKNFSAYSLLPETR